MTAGGDGGTGPGRSDDGRPQARSDADRPAGERSTADRPADGRFAVDRGAAPDGALPGDVPLSSVADAVSVGTTTGGMSAAQARWIERAIIGFCVLAIAMIFQPFSLTAFTIGCALVVAGALAFNLVPFCRPGIPLRRLGRVALIVLVVLAVAAALGIGTAFLYVKTL